MRKFVGLKKIKSDKMNIEINKKNKDKCPHCNSIERMDGDEEIHCKNCGIGIEKIGFDTGFMLENKDPEDFIGKSNGIEKLGSNIAKDKDATTMRLRRTQNNIVKKKPLILDCIIGMIMESGEEYRIVSDVSKILNDVDSKVSIGNRRDKFKGSICMNKNQKRQYKERVFAAAALYILDKSCRNTRAVQIADEWEILYNDLVKIVSFMKKNMKLIRESPNQIRTRELQYNLRNTRDFLTEQIGIVKANEVMRKAEIILENEGEPLEINDEWYTGKYVNKPSNKAVMMSFVEAMSLMKIEKSIAKKLFQRLPIPGMKYYFENISKKFL
tara:strand:+ start:1220 stop:2200 length:981 start_codon:yes stop_codon:yes gene_type:complete